MYGNAPFLVVITHVQLVLRICPRAPGFAVLPCKLGQEKASFRKIGDAKPRTKRPGKENGKFFHESCVLPPNGSPDQPTAGSCTRPASREACRRAAVKPQPSRMSHEQPRAFWRGSGCRGSPPARPASRGTCRATAVKPRPSRMSHEHPARLRRAVRLKALPYSSSKAPV